MYVYIHECIYMRVCVCVVLKPLKTLVLDPTYTHHTPIHMHSLTHPLSLTHTHAHAHARTHPLSLACSRARTHTHMYIGVLDPITQQLAGGNSKKLACY